MYGHIFFFFLHFFLMDGVVGLYGTVCLIFKIWCYIFLIKNFFWIFENLKIYKFPLILLWLMGYLDVCCLISKYLSFSKCHSVLDFWFNFAIFKKCMWYNFYYFKFVSFVGQKMPYLHEFCMCIWEEYVFHCCHMEWSVNIS